MLYFFFVFLFGLSKVLFMCLLFVNSINSFEFLSSLLIGNICIFFMRVCLCLSVKCNDVC